jgi:small-conductance mechanosensitive channel
MSERLHASQEWLAQVLAQAAGGGPREAAIGALLVTVAALGALLVLRFFFRRLGRRVERLRGTRIPPLRFQDQELLSADETTRMVQGSVRVVRLAAYLLLAYVYLNLLFQLSPVTRAISDRLLGSLLDVLRSMALAVVGYLPDLIFLIVLFLAGRWVLRLVRLVFDGIAAGRIRIARFDSEWARPTLGIVRFLIVAFLAVMAFPYLPGSASPAFQGVSIFLGVLVSLGSSGAVANVISGIVLTYTRAFRVGDRVKIADAQGDVLEKTVFVTRLRTVKNVDITIPNALVMSNHIINFSAQAAGEGLVLHTTVTIGYDTPWERVRDALLGAARATEGVLETPAPFVHQTGLDDFYVRYELNVYTREAKRMAAVYSELHRHVLEQCHAAGIEIASPHLAAVRDANALQVPADYLPKDYRPAAFRVLPLRSPRREG